MKDIMTEYADYLTDQYNAMGNSIHNAKKHGVCAHGWRKDVSLDTQECLYCHKIAKREILNEEYHDVLATY